MGLSFVTPGISQTSMRYKHIESERSRVPYIAHTMVVSTTYRLFILLALRVSVLGVELKTVVFGKNHVNSDLT